MARCVLIVDSETGALVDAAGNVREGGRYRRLAGRMLSRDKNPVLDYGANGGDRLEISKGGQRGAEINLKAEVVNVSGDLRVNGVSVSDGAGIDASLLGSKIGGEEGEIVVDEIVDPSHEGKTLLRISIADALMSTIREMSDRIMDVAQSVKKSELAYAVSGLSVSENDNLEDVKDTLRELILRIGGISS